MAAAHAARAQALSVASVGISTLTQRLGASAVIVGVLAIGFVGGLFPAVRAARMPVTAALREL